jgi:hypothetical protein
MKFIAIFLKNKIIVYLVVVLFGVILYNLIKYKEGITGNSVVQKNTPICNLMTKNDCISNTGYCEWNSKLYQCSNKHNCYIINNKSSCNNQKYCIWNNFMNTCNIKQ